MIGALTTAIVFGAFAYAGILAARTYFSDLPVLANSPPQGVPPVRAIVIVAALCGAFAALRGVPAPSLLIVAAVCGVMAAICCTDISRGLVPDALTIVPLLVLVVAGALTGRWFVLLAAALPAIPFAIVAWRSKGLGMGWGDVKLAALGGALIGMQDAMLAFAIAGIVAVVVARIRGTHRQPLAFGPYLAAAILFPLTIHTGL